MKLNKLEPFFFPVFTLVSIGLGFWFVSQRIIDGRSFSETMIFNSTTKVIRLGGTLRRFKDICGRYPTTEMGLSALIKKPKTLNCPNYPAGGIYYRDKIGTDSWGTPLKYESNNDNFILLSFGPDEIENTDDDIDFHKIRKD
jgi:hypothetical protein